MLKGLEAADLREDPETREAFRERLAPVIGVELLDDHERIVENGGECRSAWLDLTIASWLQEATGEREYSLMDHAVLENV